MIAGESTDYAPNGLQKASEPETSDKSVISTLTTHLCSPGVSQPRAHGQQQQQFSSGQHSSMSPSKQGQGRGKAPDRYPAAVSTPAATDTLRVQQPNALRSILAAPGRASSAGLTLRRLELVEKLPLKLYEELATFLTSSVSDGSSSGSSSSRSASSGCRNLEVLSLSGSCCGDAAVLVSHLCWTVFQQQLLLLLLLLSPAHQDLLLCESLASNLGNAQTSPAHITSPSSGGLC